MLQRAMNASATLRPLSPEGHGDSLGSSMVHNYSLLSPDKRTAKPFAIPRFGPVLGGGQMTCYDQKFLQELAQQNSEIEEAPQRQRRTRIRPSTVPSPETGNMKRRDSRRQLHSAGDFSSASLGLGDTSPRLSTQGQSSFDGKSHGRLSPEERKAAEIGIKWKKVNDVRSRDSIKIRDKVERRKDARDARLQRLLHEVTGRGLAYDTAMELRKFDADQESKIYEHYLEWDDKVFKPAASKCFNQMNHHRPSQQMLSGRKNVGFTLPEEPFRMHVNVSQDPCKKHLLQDAQEKAFHKAAESLLGRSQSAPDFSANIDQLHERGGVVACMPRALSRPVLEPNNWSQVEIQGSAFGRFAQNCEAGEDARRFRKGGPNAFLGSVGENDGAAMAGTKFSRTRGHRDIGILRGDLANRGESADYNNGIGASSGAPAQDHYTYEKGFAITDLEFPLGKRVFPEAL